MTQPGREPTDEQGGLVAKGAAGSGGAPRQDRPEADVEVLTQVCLKCGKEYYFDDEPPPPELRCEKCGNGVFRSYHTAVGANEAAAEFEEVTHRDLDPDDAEGDATQGDVLDLNRL